MLLPPPPAGKELAKRICNILLKDTEGFLQLRALDRKQSRELKSTGNERGLELNQRIRCMGA